MRRLDIQKNSRLSMSQEKSEDVAILGPHQLGEAWKRQVGSNSQAPPSAITSGLLAVVVAAFSLPANGLASHVSHLEDESHWRKNCLELPWQPLPSSFIHVVASISAWMPTCPAFLTIPRHELSPPGAPRTARTIFSSLGTFLHLQALSLVDCTIPVNLKMLLLEKTPPSAHFHNLLQLQPCFCLDSHTSSEGLTGTCTPFLSQPFFSLITQKLSSF